MYKCVIVEGKNYLAHIVAKARSEETLAKRISKIFGNEYSVYPAGDTAFNPYDVIRYDKLNGNKTSTIYVLKGETPASIKA